MAPTITRSRPRRIRGRRFGDSGRSLFTPSNHFFVPNELKRYSLATKSKTLKFGDDRSLTIYVQANSPGSDKEANWLPAPKDSDFSLFIRAYWPKVAITGGTWTPSAVKRKRSSCS
jgi:hypothetical protein